MFIFRPHPVLLGSPRFDGRVVQPKTVELTASQLGVEAGDTVGLAVSGLHGTTEGVKSWTVVGHVSVTSGRATAMATAASAVLHGSHDNGQP